jgi:hypothetical protein
MKKNKIIFLTGTKSIKYLEKVITKLREIEKQKENSSKEEKDKIYPKNILGL